MNLALITPNFQPYARAVMGLPSGPPAALWMLDDAVGATGSLINA